MTSFAPLFMPNFMDMPALPAPKIINGLADIAGDYKALLCDAWGVIHNGVVLFPGVEEAMVNFRKSHGPLFILTNAPRLSDVIPAQLDRLGLSREAYDGIVTSGDATRSAIEAYAGQKGFKLGPGKDDTLFGALDIEFVPMAKAQFILCTGLFDDATETPDDYVEMLTEAKEMNLPMVCANPDIVVRRGDQMIYCGGALAQLYEELGGNSILSGKPHAPIYELARERIAAIDDTIEPTETLCIGDGLQTDILGANKNDLDVVFVAEGIFSDDARNEDGVLDPAKVAALLQEHGVHAAAAMERLQW